MSGEYGGLEQVTDPAVLRERIPRIIGVNTDGPQPKTIGEAVLIQHCTHANFDSAVVRQVVSELVEDGVVVEEEGRYRLSSW